MQHTHKFEIGDLDAITTLVEKLEAHAAESSSERLRRAVKWAEQQAVKLEWSKASERDLAFFHGLLTGYAVALKL